MSTLKRRAAAIAASLTLATGGILAVGTNTATAAGANCQNWWDENTFAVWCYSPAPGYTQVRAEVQCVRGTDKGPWVSATSGVKSYAYCSDQGGLVDGWPRWR
ncbi:hypothetical protein [Streptomyces sp. GESEQ-4]|uniref:hypothetical protein n=1 Tax=Streptomyces sp. GESEQ-4 TaxID=2812655 RepID=UPI001B32ABDB|nr:hypothetical protein [Streptomyces sp. GESEQ-4]